VLPGLVSLAILSWVYAAFGSVGPVQALFFGLKAAVLAVVMEAIVRVGRRALKRRHIAYWRRWRSSLFFLRGAVSARTWAR
jgi:chromate transporter